MKNKVLMLSIIFALSIINICGVKEVYADDIKSIDELDKQAEVTNTTENAQDTSTTTDTVQEENTESEEKIDSAISDETKEEYLQKQDERVDSAGQQIMDAINSTAIDSSKDTPFVSSIKKGISTITGRIVQIVAVLIAAGSTAMVAIDLLAITIPPARFILTNGYIKGVAINRPNQAPVGRFGRIGGNGMMPNQGGMMPMNTFGSGITNHQIYNVELLVQIVVQYSY